MVFLSGIIIVKNLSTDRLITRIKIVP